MQEIFYFCESEIKSVKYASALILIATASFHISTHILNVINFSQNEEQFIIYREGMQKENLYKRIFTP